MATVKQRDLPNDPDARKIVKTLADICAASGHRPDRVFEDWLELVEATLEMLPVHAASVAETGHLAPDSPAASASWETVRRHYQKRDHAYVFQRFAAAFGTLVNTTHDDDGAPTYQDRIGEIYMAWGWPSEHLGQFFTPRHVAVLMAQLVGGGAVEQEVHARLERAISCSPLAQAALLAGVVVPDDQAQNWLLTRVLPPALEHYQPVSVCDPCVGSGVMLLAFAATLPVWMVQAGLVQFYGVDLDPTCVRMARINCLLYGLNGSSVKNGLALSSAELSLLPDGAAHAYAAAQEAQKDGRHVEVQAIAHNLRAAALTQLPLFPDLVPGV